MRTFFRLRADDLDRAVFFLQVLRHAHDGAGGAHGTDEMGDLAVGIAPDLGAGTFVMGPRVVGIAELVEDDALAILLHLLGHVARIFHAARLGRQDDLGAVGGHALAPLDRQVFRHQQHHLVAADRRCHRQCNAGVAAGRFNQGVARLDVAALFGPLEHRHGGPVLDGSGRIVAFHLAEDNIVAGRSRA